MEKEANEIQAVINTLGELDIKSTYSNMDKILGCMQLLTRVRDRIREVKPDAGKADAE